MKSAYVDLARRFIPFQEASDSDESAWISYYRPTYTGWGALSWDELVGEDSRCVVVLGEAGSGKSWEFEARAETLSSRGMTVFFLHLEDLVDREIDRCLTTDDAARLKIWLDGTDRAVFFLDSLDEARLKSRTALRKVLLALDRGLGQSLQRASIVLSCRVSEWQPRSDLDLLKSVFGNLDADENKSVFFRSEERRVRFRVVQLAALHQDQIGTLAVARGLESVDDFLAEVDRREAWMFTGRPQDAEDIIAYWKEHRKFGSLSELLEENAVRKLRERRNSDDVIDYERARVGVERLASAAILCRTSTLLIPDESAGPQETPSSIDPADVLPDFQDRERLALLGRPIFDEATYGRVRFHHRTVREYLAASWFHRLMEHGFRPEIEDLIFHYKYSQCFVPPSLLPVAAWLASTDSEIRRQLLEAEPLAVVQYGDPERIDPVDRASMLERLAGAYARHPPVFLDGASLRRFAHRSLAPKVNELLSKQNLPEQSKYFLLLLIWQGQIQGCADEAYKIATNAEEDVEIRSIAVRAVGATGDETILKRLGDYALKLNEIPRSLVGGLFDALYPRAFGVDELLGLIRKIHSGDGRRSDAPPFSLTQILNDGKRIPKDDLPTLVTQLFNLATETPLLSQSGIDLASARYAWLLEPLKVVLIRIAREAPSLANDVGLCRTFRHAFRLLALCHQYGINFTYELDDLNAVLSERTDWCRAMFWDRISEDASYPPTNRFFPETPRLTPTDFSWLLIDCQDSSLRIVDRRIAFQSAVRVWSWKPEDVEESQRQRLRAAATEPEFADYLERAEKERGEIQERQRHEAEEREGAKARKKDGDVAWLRAHIKEIRSAEYVGTLSSLTELARRKGGDRDFSSADWRKVALEFGEEIGEAARDGVITFWRMWQPPLRNEIPEDQIPGEVGIGLAGIAWEIERGLDVAVLSDAEAERAIRYALFEYNGFPDWLSQLAFTHPQVLVGVAREPLIAEFDGSSGMLLQNFSYSAGPLEEAVAPILDELLKDREPAKPQSLRYVVAILLGAGHSKTIVDLAKQRVQSGSSDKERQKEWLTAWFRLEPHGALDFIDGLPLEQSNLIVDSLVGRLGELDRRPGSMAFQDSFEASVLKRLIPLVFRQVSMTATHEEAMTRGATVSMGFPNGRFFREAILQRLASLPGTEPHRTLVELAGTPGLEDQRFRLLALAEQQASRDCEPKLRARDIPGWERTCLAAPETADDLFRIAFRRLQTLKRDIEDGDFSNRGLFNSSTNEREVQKYVANRLRIEERGQYTVSREEEVDLQYRTDIRLWYPNDLVATIEVKCADKWTYSELVDSVENQLVGKYMRDRNSHHGLLLLCHLGGKEHWKPADGKSLPFNELIDTLRKEANRIAISSSQVSSLAVVGIDFRPSKLP